MVRHGSVSNKPFYKDTNVGGQLDLLLQVRTENAEIQCDDTSAQLTGLTAAQARIEESDAIRTVGCN